MDPLEAFVVPKEPPERLQHRPFVLSNIIFGQFARLLLGLVAYDDFLTALPKCLLLGSHRRLAGPPCGRVLCFSCIPILESQFSFSFATVHSREWLLERIWCPSRPAVGVVWKLPEVVFVALVCGWSVHAWIIDF